MKKLTSEAQARAETFIDQHARPLERCIAAAYFGQGSQKAIFDALAKFQNPDGGFGNALEPDLRLPDSSVLATTVALQTLRAFDASADHVLVRGAMHYLLQTFNPAAMTWPFIPPNVDDAPHAPWWTYSENIAESWNDFLVNPRVEIIGYLHDYGPRGLPAWVRDSLTQAAVNYIEEAPDKIQMFDLLCYNRLIQSKALPEPTRQVLIEKLTPLVDKLVVKDPGEWEGYSLAPLELVDAPDAPFADLLAESVAQHLDFEIAHQQDNGSWQPKWTWGGMYPETWPQAKEEWAGVLTVKTLNILKNFRRLA